MSNTAALLAQAKAAKEKGLLKDQTEESQGGFDYEPPAAGPCLARLVGYIEIGSHKPKVDKYNKGAQPKAFVEFELLGKKHAKEIEVNGVKKIVYPIIREELTISNSAKSWFYRLVTAMDYGRGGDHMAFMLGEAFKITVLHNEAEKDGKKVVYANIRDDSGWKVGAPVQEKVNDEGEIEIVKLNAPAATVEPRLLLWDAPSIEQWDSIFIEGTREIEKDGKKTEVSKNWIQERIIAAENFKGSALEAVLSSAQLPGGAGKPQEDVIEDDLTEDALEDVPAASGQNSGVSDDPLADLGL